MLTNILLVVEHLNLLLILLSDSCSIVLSYLILLVYHRFSRANAIHP